MEAEVVCMYVRFRELDVWRYAMALVDRIYAETSRFPDAEKFGITSQLRRAAISVPANISEGAGRRRGREFLRFLDIAYGSLMEVQTLVEVARRQGLLDDESTESLLESCFTVARLANGLRRRLQRAQD